MRTRKRTPWPARVALDPHPAPPAAVAAGHVAVTFIGHATFLIRTASTVMLTDPVFTSHAGPFGRIGPHRVRPPAIAASALSPVASSGTPVASAVGRKISELDWWQRTTVGGAEITCVPAQHFSSRTPWDRDRTLWCGYVVRVDGVTIYFAGDTGYGPQFRDIGDRCPSIDVALVPIGAYEPRWFMAPVHMNPEEAVRAHRDLRPRVSIGMHFGTFQLTDEAIDAPLRALERAREAHAVGADAFRVLDFGESQVV